MAYQGKALRMILELNSNALGRLGKMFKSRETTTGFARARCLSTVVFLLLFNVIAEGAPDKTVYIGEEVKFTNTTKGPPGMKWEWDFGDKSPKSDKREPTHIYKEPGTWTVSLTVEVPGAGKQPPAKLEIKVLPVIAKAAAAPLEIYIGQEVKFTNKTEGPPGMKWEWDFGDDSPKSTEKEPTHIYKKPGTWTVSLTVEVLGAGEQPPAKLEIKALPVIPVIAKAAASPSGIYIGQEVKLPNYTEGPPGLKWEWDFGDGGPKSTEKEPAHIYKKPGTWVVTLTVEVPNVGKLEPVKLEVKVLNVNATAEASEKRVIKKGDREKFTGVIDGPPGCEIRWYSGDGYSSEEWRPAKLSPDKNTFEHTYNKVGTFDACFEVKVPNIAAPIKSNKIQIKVEQKYVVPSIDVDAGIKREPKPTVIVADVQGNYSGIVLVDVNGTYINVAVSGAGGLFDSFPDSNQTDKKNKNGQHRFTVTFKRPERVVSFFSSPNPITNVIDVTAVVYPKDPDDPNKIAGHKFGPKKLTFELQPERKRWVLLVEVGVGLLVIGILGAIYMRSRIPFIKGTITLGGEEKDLYHDLGPARGELEISLEEYLGDEFEGWSLTVFASGSKRHPDTHVMVIGGDIRSSSRGYIEDGEKFPIEEGRDRLTIGSQTITIVPENF